MAKTPAGQTRAKLYDFVCQRILHGAPPSVREVQEHFRFKSSATARQHLNALVSSGLLDQIEGQDRGYRIPGADMAGLIPVLGRVQAGGLSEAIEQAEGYVPVSADSSRSCFALTVVGESMAGREIHDGDLVLVDRDQPVRSGDVVVALVGDEATIKTYVKTAGKIIFKAENPAFDDIVPHPDGPECRLLGRVFEVRKSL